MKATEFGVLKRTIALFTIKATEFAVLKRTIASFTIKATEFVVLKRTIASFTTISDWICDSERGFLPTWLYIATAAIRIFSHWSPWGLITLELIWRLTIALKNK
jgi:hypothetical protein